MENVSLKTEFDAPPRAERAQWLDVSRGIGIVLVVIGHACGGLIDAGLDNSQQSLRSLFLLIYIFHMPLFFMLAGVTIQSRVEKDPRKFGLNILSRIVYPYYLWSTVQLTVIIMAGSSINSPYSGNALHQLLTLPWSPVSQFWFLQTLALLQLFSLILLPRVGPAIFLLLAFFFKSANEIVALPQIFSSFSINAPYFAIGVFFGIQGFRTNLLNRLGWIKLLLLVLGAFYLEWLTYSAIVDNLGSEAFAGASAPTIATLAGGWRSFAAALLCSAAVVSISALPAVQDSRLLSYLGRRSFSIFVLHVMFVVGARICLVRLFGISNAMIILPTITMIGLAGPVIVDQVLGRFKLSKWVGLP
jgi:fucose 4-O-acetylase-like acetyltransferase